MVWKENKNLGNTIPHVPSRVGYEPMDSEEITKKDAFALLLYAVQPLCRPKQ
jgi:hypothetical protein